ncbi:hypothetical protein HGM15179_002207, partial [Zosterops borbonicus]
IDGCLFITGVPLPPLPLGISWRRQWEPYTRHAACPPAAQWSLRQWESKQNRTV